MEHLVGASAPAGCESYLIDMIINQNPLPHGPETPISRSCQIAVVGLGKIAIDQHLPAIAGNPAFTLAATVDFHRGPAGVAHFRSLEALLASGLAIDAVALCTPPQVRGQLAHEAIDAGLAVLLEKPPATTLAELAALQHRADAKGVSLFAAWHSRFAPMVEQARAWLARRRVSGGSVDWREDVRRWHPGQRWLWQPNGLGVFDPGINALSILTDILPTMPAVLDSALDIPANVDTPIAARLALSAGHATISVTLDFLQTGPQTWDIALETDDGHRLRLGDGGATLAIDDGPMQRGVSAEYPALYARFAELIAAGTSDADGAPLALVAEALAKGSVRRTEPFIE
jgi:D-galactose 1-dehydrogenase